MIWFLFVLLFVGVLYVDFFDLCSYKWLIGLLVIVGVLIVIFVIGGLVYYIFLLFGW